MRRESRERLELDIVRKRTTKDTKNGRNLRENNSCTARVDLNEDAGLFHGQVLGIRDVVTFQGESVTELPQAFHDSVDDYLDFCKERGEEPDKPFSGNFMVRVSPELHRAASIQAEAAGVSLNQWVSAAIEANLKQSVTEC